MACAIRPSLDGALLSSERVVRLAPLLSPVLRLPIDDNPYTATLSGEARLTQVGYAPLIWHASLIWRGAPAWRRWDMRRASGWRRGWCGRHRGQSPRVAGPGLVWAGLGQGGGWC
eukprot:5705410-Prymnesium_polylepis.1